MKNGASSAQDGSTKLGKPAVLARGESVYIDTYVKLKAVPNSVF